MLLGRGIAVELCKNAQRRGRCAMIYSPGLGSVKVGEKSEALRKYCMERLGVDFVRYDLYGHGDSAGDFTGLTISGAVQDLRDVMEFVKRETECEQVICVGASFGGYISMLVTADSKPQSLRVHSLLLIGASYEFAYNLLNINPDSHGRRILHSPYTNTDFIFSPAFSRDAESYKHQTCETLGQRLAGQVVVVAHGELDTICPIDSARSFFLANNNPLSRFLPFPDGDHRLNTPIHAIIDNFHSTLSLSSS